MKTTLLILALSLIAVSVQAEEHVATVLKVTDGDTMLVRFDLGLDVSVVGKVRLAGVDCPELKTARGKEVRSEVQAMLEGKLARIDVLGKEKYGRWLGVLYLGDRNINEWLVQTGRAKAYDGGKRE